MSLPSRMDLIGDRYGVYHGDTWGPHIIQLCRVALDGNISLAGNVLTSATAAFTADDVGAPVAVIDANGKPTDALPANATITTYTNGTTVGLSHTSTKAVVLGNVVISRRDVTGHTFLSQIRTSRQATGDPLATIAVTVSSATNGTLSLKMANTVTETLPQEGATYVWDLQSTDGSGNVKTWLTGNVAVTWDVSRA